MVTATKKPLPIKPLPEFAGILREQQQFSTGEDEGISEQLNSSFDRLMLQSGMEMQPMMVLLLSFCTAITVGGIAFVIQENFLTTGLAAAVGAAIPIVSMIIIRNQRQSQILNQMPGAVDELARAAKTGRSLEQCFQVVADDTPAPLGDELRRCVRKMELGMGLSAALRDLPMRTGLVSMNVLVMALTVHQQTGGDLVVVLNRLSRTIRDRISFLGRLRAATAASRATAMMMIALPPGIVLFFAFRDPDYFNRLMGSVWGRNVTITAVILQIIGAIWVLRILKSSQRS